MPSERAASPERPEVTGPALTRLTLLGFLLLVPGLYYFLRFSSGFLRVLFRKFRRGKPYLKGSASDYLLFALGCFLAALAGAGLLAASALQGGFQRVAAPREVGDGEGGDDSRRGGSG